MATQPKSPLDTQLVVDFPMECAAPQTASITMNNATTLLLRLPRELRLKIYGYVLDDCGDENNIMFVETAHPRDRPLPGRWRWLNTDNIPEDKFGFDGGVHRVYFGRGTGIAFLRTCRQIWFEAFSALHDDRLISFSHIEGFFRYQYHIHIRRLRLAVRLPSSSSEWETRAWVWFCKIAADDMNLTHLFLLVTLDYDISPSLQSLWLKPLFRIRGLRSFGIRVQVEGGWRLRDLEKNVKENMLGPRVDQRENDDERSRLLTPKPLKMPEVYGFTDEQARFIFFYATLTYITPYQLADIFSSYFHRITENSIVFAIGAIKQNDEFDTSTLAICEDEWADPALFGFERRIWK
ncbi:MAG: hypothetical protein M1839_008796 [Geoglossum umbratile]|nr:MAG: hypothetical protein M1839_008796 [Geoglossum umbratile]